jgi:hypothetical protein
MQATCSLPHHVSLQQILTAATHAQKAPSLAFLDQDADRIGAKSSRAFQIELSETLTPLPDAPVPGTFVAAVPVQRDRRSMSRRPGQNGRIEKRGNSFSLLFYQDVPGTTKRQRVRRTLNATTMVAAKQEAQRIIDAEGVNTAAHLEASRGPVVRSVWPLNYGSLGS